MSDFEAEFDAVDEPMGATETSKKPVVKKKKKKAASSTTSNASSSAAAADSASAKPKKTKKAKASAADESEEAAAPVEEAKPKKTAKPTKKKADAAVDIDAEFEAEFQAPVAKSPTAILTSIAKNPSSSGRDDFFGGGGGGGGAASTNAYGLPQARSAANPLDFDAPVSGKGKKAAPADDEPLFDLIGTTSVAPSAKVKIAGADDDEESEPVNVDAIGAAMANLNALTESNAPKKPTGKKPKGNQPTLNQLSSSTTLGFSLQPTTTTQAAPAQAPYGFQSGGGGAPTGGYGMNMYGFPATGAPTGGYGGGGGGMGGGYGMGMGGGFPSGPAAATGPAGGKKAGGDAFSQLNIWN